MSTALLDDVPAGAYAVPTAAGSATLQITDTLLSTVVFFLALMQQVELDRSIYYVPLIAAIFLAIVVCQAVQEWMRATAEHETYHRHTLATVISKLAMLMVAYLMGLLTRSVSGNITNGPALGHFTAASLLPTVVVIVLIVVRIYHVDSISRHRVDIVRWLPAMTT